MIRFVVLCEMLNQDGSIKTVETFESNLYMEALKQLDHFSADPVVITADMFDRENMRKVV